MSDERILSNLISDPAPKSGRREFLAVALLALTAAGLYLPLLRRMLSAYDYVHHLHAARTLAETGSITTPHMLFHALTAAGSRLFAVDIATSGLAVLLLCVASTVFLICWFWLRRLPAALPARLCMAVALLFVAPLTLLYPVDHHLYFGYIAVNVFHNPTMLVLKLFSLLLFGYSSFVFVEQGSENRRKILLLALPVVVVCGALAKPSYLICFLPSLTLFLVVRAFRKTKVDWPLFLGGILLPALLVLSLQYYLTYSHAQMEGFYGGRSAIIFAPFKVVAHYSGWLLAKFFLSVAFPLAVCLLFWRSAVRDAAFSLAWLTVGVGTFQVYFLMEAGPRAYQGNFWWSGQITLFVLFVASADHLLKNGGPLRDERGWNLRYLCCLGIFVLHLLAGIAFYGAEFSQTERYW